MITTGLGPIYDGVAHFALTPEDLIPVVGLAVLAGLRGAKYGRWSLFILPAFWLVGGAAGMAIARPANNFVAPLSRCLVGGLVAADAPFPYGPRLRWPRFSRRRMAMRMARLCQAAAAAF